MTDDVARIIFFQLIQTVQYLHKNNICHGDIKGGLLCLSVWIQYLLYTFALIEHQLTASPLVDENILIDSDLKIKLIDFGSASMSGRLADMVLASSLI